MDHEALQDDNSRQLNLVREQVRHTTSQIAKLSTSRGQPDHITNQSLRRMQSQLNILELQEQVCTKRLWMLYYTGKSNEYQVSRYVPWVHRLQAELCQAEVDHESVHGSKPASWIKANESKATLTPQNEADSFQATPITNNKTSSSPVAGASSPPEELQGRMEPGTSQAARPSAEAISLLASETAAA